jgi:hypothetical protein
MIRVIGSAMSSTGARSRNRKYSVSGPSKNGTLAVA